MSAPGPDGLTSPRQEWPVRTSRCRVRCRRQSGEPSPTGPPPEGPGQRSRGRRSNFGSERTRSGRSGPEGANTNPDRAARLGRRDNRRRPALTQRRMKSKLPRWSQWGKPPWPEPASLTGPCRCDAAQGPAARCLDAAPLLPPGPGDQPGDVVRRGQGGCLQSRTNADGPTGPPRGARAWGGETDPVGSLDRLAVDTLNGGRCTVRRSRLFNGMKLGGWIGLPSAKETRRRPETNSGSCSAAHPQGAHGNPRRTFAFSARHRCGECCAKGRLEHRWEPGSNILWGWPLHPGTWKGRDPDPPQPSDEPNWPRRGMKPPRPRRGVGRPCRRPRRDRAGPAAPRTREARLQPRRGRDPDAPPRTLRCGGPVQGSPARGRCSDEL